MKNLFSKRETPSQNIAYISILVALNGLFSLVASFTTLGGFFLMLFLPLTSTLAWICCEKRYIPVYLGASVGISFLTSFWALSQTIFYVIPGLTLGTLYGYFFTKKVPTSLSMLILSILNICIAYLSLLLIKLIYGIEIIEVLLHIFNLEVSTISTILVPSAMFVYSLAQVLIIHYFVIAIGEKIGIEEVENPAIVKYFDFSCLVIAGLSIGLSFVSLSIGYFLMFIGFYLAMFALFSTVENKTKLNYFILISLAAISLIIIPILYPLFADRQGLIILNGISLALALADILNKIITRNWGDKE